MKRMMVFLLALALHCSCALAKDYALVRGEDAAAPEVYLAADTLDALFYRAERMQTLESLIGDWRVYFWEEEGGGMVRVYV